MELPTLARAPLLEQRRVGNHLRGAEKLVHRSTRSLDSARRLNRSLLIDELARYRKAGRFPRNRDFAGALVPYFIDEDGTRCALAHLIEVSGHGELVQHVAEHRNNARVAELASCSELRAWLASSGLTLEEAARIQPSYCHETRAEQCFCNWHASRDGAVIIGTVLEPESLGMVRVRVERIEGPIANLSVGDEITANGTSAPGELALFKASPNNDGGTSVWEVGYDWSVTPETVTCSTDFGREHPVPTDLAIAALRSEQTECVALLAAQDVRWKGSRCEDGGCGCRVLSGAADAPAFTALAVLSALLAYRRRRRARSVRG
jgi:MYXO-CTERM domain-containing protein